MNAPEEQRNHHDHAPRPTCRGFSVKAPPTVISPLSAEKRLRKGELRKGDEYIYRWEEKRVNQRVDPHRAVPRRRRLGRRMQTSGSQSPSAFERALGTSKPIMYSSPFPPRFMVARTIAGPFYRFHRGVPVPLAGREVNSSFQQPVRPRNGPAPRPPELTPPASGCGAAGAAGAADCERAFGCRPILHPRSLSTRVNRVAERRHASLITHRFRGSALACGSRLNMLRYLAPPAGSARSARASAPAGRPGAGGACGHIFGQARCGPKLVAFMRPRTGRAVPAAADRRRRSQTAASARC